MRAVRRAWAPLAVFALVGLAGTVPARAATFLVNDTGEAGDADTGDGVCATAGATCTLRAAIEQANALSGAAHTIELPAGTYEQSATLPSILQDVVVAGAGAATTIVRSSDAGRPRLFLVPAGGTLALADLTLTNAALGPGSAVYATGGDVTLTRCAVTGNLSGAVKGDVLSTVMPPPSLTVTGTTFSGNTNGTALEAANYDLVVDGCTFDDNHQPNYGGALALGGTGAGRSHAITHSTFTANSATFGAALYLGSPPNTPVAITGCGFADNVASGGGGAIYSITPGVQIADSSFTGNQTSAGNGGAILSPQTAFMCTGCTFSANTAGGTGGAVCASRNELLNSTFVANASGSLGGAVYVDNPSLVNALRAGNLTVTGNAASTGGGIYGGGPNVVVKNSLVALNTAASGPDCGGIITSQGYNLVGDSTGCGLVTTAGDQVGTSASPIVPGLSLLADNGGPTRTVALLPGSPAIDAGNPSGCTDFATPTAAPLGTDQRGFPRPTDGDGTGGAVCDVGAFEAPAAVTTTTTAGSTSTTTTTTTTSTTSTTTLPAVCAGGVTISRARLTLTHVAPPAGDEGFVLAGVLDFPPGRPATFDPATTGAQLLVEDLGAGGAAIFELSHRTAPIPAGSGCDRGDGWKRGRYVNASGRIDLPACTPGSANGLRLLRFQDRRRKGKGVVFTAVGKRASVGQPIGPFRVTVVLGSSAVASVVGDCGAHPFAPSSCRRRGAVIRCR